LKEEHAPNGMDPLHNGQNPVPEGKLEIRNQVTTIQAPAVR